MKFQLPYQEFVFRTIDCFFHSYLTERSMEKTLSFLSEQFFSIGTGEHEIARNRREFEALLREELSTMQEPITYTFNSFESKEIAPGCFSCVAAMTLLFRSPEEIELQYSMRISASLHQEGNRYIIDTIHASAASAHQQEGEYFPFQFVSEEMNRLNRQTQQDLMDLMTEVIPGGVIGGYLEEGFPLYVVNDQLLSMVGYTYEEFLADTGGLVLNSIHESDREMVCQQIREALVDGMKYEIEYRLKKKGGSFFWVYDIGRKTTTSDGREAIISILIDITHRIEAEEMLRGETMLDFLTGLYNRKGGQEQIQFTMKHCTEYYYLMADLDNFKQVNDLYGHDSGDEVLCFFAGQLTKAFRKSDTIYRIGGDEFIIFIPDCTSREVIDRKISGIIGEYRAFIAENYPDSHSTLSFGGVHGTEKHTPAELYHLADQVLYQVKHSGKNQMLIQEI